MSGIEVAGLVIGIVPIVVEILRSYGIAKNRLKAFAHHAQVVYDVRLRYRVAATNFSNDCQLLLKAIVEDARELSQMVDDPTHDGWRNPSLEDRLHTFLGRDYQLFEEVVLKIRDVLRATRIEISQFDACVEPDESESRTMVLKRVYQAFDIPRKENAYRRWLDDLDQWNTKLSRLRTQRCKLQKQRSHRMDGLIRKSTPKRYTDIRTASQKLHDSLRDSWSCTNISHVEHQAKLSLDARAEYGTAHLDIVIACRRKQSTKEAKNSPKSPSEPPIWLQVRSITTNESTQQCNLKSVALLESVQTSGFAPTAPPFTEETSSPMQSAMHKAKKTLKRVRFSTPSAHSPPASPLQKVATLKPASDSTDTTFAMLDLKATTSVCCHLSQACRSASCKDVSLGYLETLEAPPSFKFIFYDAGRKNENKITQSTPEIESCSIQAELANFQVLHQLTLAHRLATAVLQYHSTSWLSQDWGLENISYFTDCPFDTTKAHQEENITNSLQTLHLSTQFPQETSTVKNRSDSDMEQLKYIFGIRNLTLAKLGVALIEIGTKKELADVDLDSSILAPRGIINARKILVNEPLSLAMLGKRYVKMARKCIDCDFSCGDDLASEALQSAVYTDIICELESQIADWKKFIGVN